jgi:hypothetical protein
VPFAVGQLAHHAGHVHQTGHAGGAQAALAGHELVFAGHGRGRHEERLGQTVHLDGLREFRQRIGGEARPGLVAVGAHLVHGNFNNRLAVGGGAAPRPGFQQGFQTSSQRFAFHNLVRGRHGGRLLRR